MRSRLKFAHKIIAMPLLAGLAILLTVAVVQINGAQTTRKVWLIKDGHVPKRELSRDLTDLLTAVQRGLQDAAVAADLQLLDEVDADHDAFLALLAEHRGNPTLSETELDDLATAFTSYYRRAREAAIRLMTGTADESTLAGIEQMVQDHASLTDAVEQFSASAREDMERAVAGTPFSDGSEVYELTVSIGVAATSGTTEVLARADARLYEAKGRGRNQVA